MERQSTPPLRSAPRATPISPPTPEVTRRIEESRLRAKAIRERREAENFAREPTTTNRTPSGFLITPSEPTTGQKRPHTSISSAPAPGTVRDASKKVPADEGIQAARNFKKYVDHDFSKMTDTKGGFLSVEDDPFNRALHAPVKEGDKKKPEHMSLKEWENMQLIKQLRKRREGPFEPGLSVLEQREQSKKCRECGGLEIDWEWEEVFGCCVCRRCVLEDQKEVRGDEPAGKGMYSLLTKTQCKEDYLLTDPELKDRQLLPRLTKPNPHKSHYSDMQLFMRYQVEEYAFSSKKWGGEEGLDKEYYKRKQDQSTRSTKRFESKLKELKKKTMTDAFKRRLKEGKSGGKAGFGDRIGNGVHEHDWGVAVENEDGATVKTCVECGMEVEELEF